MARPTPLSDDELAEHLKDIPLWRRDGATIVREIPCSDFASAIGLVNAIALHAEKMDHHPDLLVYGWNKVRITLSTHDQGALTILDIRLAKTIDTISTSTLAH
ncbi:MAG: 4a-hydroxytetrahydrobiopterin dehydratase [Ignavibacteriae bacterium]|nr:MAG: 4a-hydroxytetrahydrobiopterin dehydratase [Ignavibacteriota bacterium]